MSLPPSAQPVGQVSSPTASRDIGAAAQPLRDAFDGLAASYDDDFTDSLIGRLQREGVWRCLDGVFASGSRILDLGCGTGADAIHFAHRGVEVEAVDLSQRMIRETQRKIAAEGLSGRITASVLAIEGLGAWDRQSCLSHAAFDGAFSNFGALNCVRELRPVARALGWLVRPGGHLAICIISRFCLWETVIYGLQGRFRKAARRWGNGGLAAGSLDSSAHFPVFYRSAQEVAAAFRPEFQLAHRRGIGIAVPPTYLEAHARRLPHVTRLAARIDRSIADWPVARGVADHTLLVFRREYSS